jgi:hypothetical protein
MYGTERKSRMNATWPPANSSKMKYDGLASLGLKKSSQRNFKFLLHELPLDVQASEGGRAATSWGSLDAPTVRCSAAAACALPALTIDHIVRPAGDRRTRITRLRTRRLGFSLRN